MHEKGSKKIRLHLRFITSYKKNTIAVFLSFALTLLLMTTMLVLLHTNHKITNIQAKMTFTPMDCYISGLSGKQVGKLKKDKDLEHLAVEQERNYAYERNNQAVFLSKGNQTAAVMMAKVTEGRLPEKEGEVAAEKWVLLNLGVEPIINQTFTVRGRVTGKKKKCKVVGILSDIYGNKKYGSLNLYMSLDKKTKDPYIAYLKLKQGIDYDEKMKSLQSELGIRKKQIKVCPGREDFRELYRTDAEVAGVFFVVGMVIFYGIYRISFITREKQYGILRAVGMERKQLRNMILLELYEIYLASVPVGIGMGLLVAFFVITVSGDRDMEIYFFNQTVPFTPVVPVIPILICVILTAFFVGFLGIVLGRKAAGAPIAETISGSRQNGKEVRSHFRIRASAGRMNTLLHMGFKYIFKDVKTSGAAILTICLGITLFTGLAYQAQITGIYREDTKEMWYLNGQYAMTMQAFGSAKEGISRQSVEDIRKTEGVASIKTIAGMPVRVVDEDHIKRNDRYYDDMNQRLLEVYDYGRAGHDGKNQIYKSILYGYNQEALKELKKYVISGDNDLEHIKNDEVILSILRMDDTGVNEFPGAYKEGTPLMQYQAGDEIQIKYRTDFHTDTEAYEKLNDTDGEYRYKSYKIKAIVSFPYMLDCNRTVYPLLITSDRQMRKIVPDGCIQCMYVDGKESLSKAQQIMLERRLIRVATRNENIVTRSLISEIKEIAMFYRKQMFYLFGIAVISGILLLMNMVNNLRYRMQTRTGEICMLRAVGMSVSMTRKLLLLENMVLGVAAVLAAFALTHPVLWYLYRISNMRAFGHPFHFAYGAFAVISAAALLLCMALSLGIRKSWKTRRIMEEIGNVE